MSPYWIAWGILCLFTIKEAVVPSKPYVAKCEFSILFIAMTAFLMLRYGQGTDYFGYYYNYIKVSDKAIMFPNYGMHGDLGYLLVCNIFRMVHFPFEGFVMLISAVQMGGLLRFLRKYEICTPFALLLSVPTLYFVYFMSGLRQGIIIALFLGVLLPLLENRRYIEYLLLTLLCISVHSVSLIFIVLLPAQWIKKISSLQIITILAWIGGILLATPAVQGLFSILKIGDLQYYLGDIHLSAFAMAERIFSLSLVTYIYEKNEKNSGNSARYKFVYRCYLMAMAVYGLLCWNDLVASRTSAALRFVEIYLLTVGVKKMDRFGRYLVTFALTGLSSLIVMKNINAAIAQGNYPVNVALSNYPYITIFEKKSIFEYRTLPTEYWIVLGKELQ